MSVTHDGIRSILALQQSTADVAHACHAQGENPPRGRSPRRFAACAFCALLDWSETRAQLYLAGPHCTIPDPAAVASLLAADWYHTHWPLIPLEELYASAVDFPHRGPDGSMTTTKALLHKRRVPPEALVGEVPVDVCSDCHAAFWKRKPFLSKASLANFLWLGRHDPLFREAALGHQLLLALGRTVSTKVYLSSKGTNQSTRQQLETWRHKFLQTGMTGTAIVYGNGNIDDAMRSFPPSTEVLQDTFVAVFGGPASTSDRTLTPAQQEQAAREALRREVPLKVHKASFEKQARRLLATNYVYKERGNYRTDLVQEFPDEAAVPSCFEACAKFIPVTTDAADVTHASGPSSATTSAQQEAEAVEEQDAHELVQWMSLLDEQLDDVAELTSLPALQGLLERMESQAGRVVANELMAVVEQGGYGAMDDMGRNRLRSLCEEFHKTSAKVSKEQEIASLHYRVQALARTEQSGNGSTDAAETEAKRPAMLQVPTTRNAESWWSPLYWSIARPTDFCYGDCVWGLEYQPVPLSVIEWIHVLYRREELEYSLPDDTEPYRAAPFNRFRRSWYDLHLTASFWRVTETTKSVHSFLKTPGAYGYASACAQVTPPMLEEVMLKSQERGGKPSVQSLLSDKDLPQQVRQAFTSLHQATASLIGSDGHRRLLQREGIAYTLYGGPPVIFTTPNLADTKQPLLLIVQGEEIALDCAIEAPYREMVQRVAADPVGQAMVFEFMIRLFFIHVLGIRADLVGWKRGEARRSAQNWVRDGVAADCTAPWLFGPIAAAFGPIEAQGRGSLHPHILVWLLQICHQELLELLFRDRDTFQERLRVWMSRVIEAVVATQESAVTELLPRMQGGQDRTGAGCAPLPFGPKEKANFSADGDRETATTAELGIETEEADADAAGVPERDLYYFDPTAAGDEGFQPAERADLPLRNTPGDVVDAESWLSQHAEETKGMWGRPVSAWASGTFPSYRRGEEEEKPQALKNAIPSDEWLRAMCADARDLVLGCAIHFCSPSCHKYHSKGTSHICRHNFYHVVTFVDEDWTEIRRRRRGKELRGCIGIFRDTRYGMAGRILTFQLHPWECPSNYAALVAMRCNVDVQDLRRVLPPRLWMPEAELEPVVEAENADNYTHGAYPQRVKQFSVGAQQDWGWFHHLGCTEHYAHEMVVCSEWHDWFTALAGKDRVPDTELSETLRDIKASAAAAAVAAFVDSHNTGYYVNSYTTKLNPTLDGVLSRLMDGVRRLNAQWEDEELKKQAGADAGPAGNGSTDAASNARRQKYRRTMQMLTRFESCFRRTSWKSGCEMVFPILFGHLCFATHRCWTLSSIMKYSITPNRFSRLAA